MTIPTSDTVPRPSASIEAAQSRASSEAPPLDSVPLAAAERRSPGSRRRFMLHFCVVLLVASGLAMALGGLRAALSVALGVSLAGANLLLMQKITGQMTGNGDGAGNAAWALVLPFKLVALVGVAYALVRGGVAQPVPLAMGFALLPLTSVFLPRPTSVPGLDSRSRAQRIPSHPAPLPVRRGGPPARRSQPAA